MAATACANCSSREDIGDVGDSWAAGVKRMEGSEKPGEVGQ